MHRCHRADPFDTVQVNEQTFQRIQKISDETKRDVMINGPVYRCVISDDQSIAFKTYLVKVDDAYHAQLQFAHAVPRGDIQVHFNVHCDASVNFFQSSHPTLMDVKWNSTFHIRLPQIDSHRDSMTISISAMMHNLDTGVDSIQNTLQATDMTTLAQQHALPDILSTTYGVSNSIISILDSISDIYFVVVLFILSAKDNAAIATLAVGNLISSALGIGMYLSNGMGDDFTAILGFACLFAAVSPIMPALTWVLDEV